MNQRLELQFRNAEGSIARISLPNPDANIEAAMVKEAMDQVITLGALAPGGYDLVEAVSARIITTEVTDFDLGV